MKRFIILLSTLLCLTALTAQEITVESVEGTVKYEVSAGVWEILTMDSALTEMSLINTGLNSTLTLLLDGKEIVIKAMQRGTVKDLSKKMKSSGGGITLGGSLTSGTLNTETGQDRTNISTASTRASDAKEDLDWEDEDE